MAAKPDIPLPIIVTHDEKDLGGPLIVLENLWPEKGKPQTGVPYTIHNLPGVKQLFANTSAYPGSPGQSGPTGIFSRDGIYNGDTIFFTRDALIYGAPSGIGGLNLPGSISPVTGGAYETNDTASLEMADIRQFLAWVEGTTAVAMDNGGNVAPIAGIPATVVDVASIAKRFYFADGADDTIHFCDLDTVNYNALNTFQGEVISDTNQSLYADDNNLYIGSSTRIEVHRPVPDPDLPMAYTGVSFPFGAPSPAAWAHTLGHVFTVGQTPQGARGIYKINGGTYEKISPHWLDRRLELLNETNYPEGSVVGTNANDISSIKRVRANAYTIEGHSVYELYIPGVEIDDVDYPPLTISYDVTSQGWFKITRVISGSSAVSNNILSPGRRFHGVDSRFNRHLLAEVTQIDINNGVHALDGRFGEVDRTELQYFGEDRPFKWCTFQSTERVFEVEDFVQQLNMVEVDPAATTKDAQFIKVPKASVNGYSADAGALYDYSDDLGVTFQSPRTVTFNFHNKSGHYLASRRGGEVRQPGRIYRWHLNYPCNIQIGPMFINIETLN